MAEATLSPEVQIKLIEIVAKATISTGSLIAHQDQIKNPATMFDIFYKSLAKTIKENS